MSQICLQYEALEGTPISEAPFRHVVVSNFVLEEDLQALINLMPIMRSGGSFPPEGLNLHPVVKALASELQGPKLKMIVARKFGLDLENAPSMLTLRGRTRKKDGCIHRDSDAKLVTILLYLNPESAAWSAQEGCLRLLNGPDDLEDYAVEVKPAHGTLLIFPNGPETWHGHRQHVGRRYAIQLNYMATNRKARYEMRRHRLSALVKRLSFTR